MSKKIFISLCIILSAALLTIAKTTFSEDSDKEGSAYGLMLAEFEKAIMENKNIVKIVKKAIIDKDFSPPFVVMTAVKAGGDIEQAIVGALEAGASITEISKKVIEMGYDPSVIFKAAFKAGRDMESIIIGTADAGVPVTEIVRIVVEMDYDLSVMIRAAFRERWNMESVIITVLEAGVLPDILARKAIEAGADIIVVAEIIERERIPGLAYTPPETVGPGVITIGLPGDRYPPLSPSSF